MLQSIPAKPLDTEASSAAGVSSTVDPPAVPSRKKKRRKRNKAAQPNLVNGHAEENRLNGHGDEVGLEPPAPPAAGNGSDEDSDEDYEEWSGFEGSPLPSTRSPTQLGGPLVSPSACLNSLSAGLLTRYGP